MKNIQYTIGFIALIILTGCSSCKKNANPPPDNAYDLPNATQTGANIFACRINGKNFITDNSKIKPGGYPYYVGGGFASDTLYFAGQSNNSAALWSLYFNVPKNAKEGNTYNIDGTNANSILITDSVNCQGIIFNIYKFPSIKGDLVINRLDKVNKIMSGTFNCTIPITVLNCDTLNITDGRFDIHYSY